MQEYWMEVYDAMNILVHEQTVHGEELEQQVSYYLMDYDRVEITRV